MAGLIENGVNPEALAAVVKELKRETEALKVSYTHLQGDIKEPLRATTRNEMAQK